MKIKFEKSLLQKGTVLVIAFVIMGVLLILGVYFLSFSLTESKISQSQTKSIQTYYLAEAGINKAIWKLKNDDEATAIDGDVPWATCFVTTTAECGDCLGWSATFSTSTDGLVPNSSVTVAIKNSTSTCARGRITATSTLTLPGGKTAQRVIETMVFKSLDSPTQDAAVFSGGTSENVDVDNSKIKVYGNLFCNHNLDIDDDSIVEIYRSAATSTDGKALTVGNLLGSDEIATSVAKCAKNMCETTSTCACTNPDEFQECTTSQCRPQPISTPIVDFDSPTSTSFKERASSTEAAGDCQVFCKKEGQATTTCSTECLFEDPDDFEDLLWQVREGGILTLGTTATPTITYVTGPIDLKGGRHLVVNGALVADGTINIGESYKWTRGDQKDEGNSQLTINRPTATTTSGLLTKAKINFGQYSSLTPTTITGVICANDEIRLVSLPESFTVTGGIIGRKLAFTSVLQWFTFVLDNEVIRYGLGYKIDNQIITPAYSPIVTVEHWEETY